MVSLKYVDTVLYRTVGMADRSRYQEVVNIVMAILKEVKGGLLLLLASPWLARLRQAILWQAIAALPI